jgi:pimeloyl-ACP methyl ester carboxylesterase
VTELKKELIDVPPMLASGRPPLLFVHGAYTGAWCWREHFLPHFASMGYRSFALSLRGHGESEGRQGLSGWSIADYTSDACWAIDNIRALTGRSPVLIGHSMGGFVSLQAARTQPLSGIALLATVPPEGLVGSALHLCWRHPQLVMELGMVQHGQRLSRLSTLREMLFSPDLDNDLLQSYAFQLQAESDRALVDMSLPQWDIQPPRGYPPALVLASRDDILMPAHLSHCAARHLGVKAHLIIDGVGHLMMLDAGWRRAADVLADWLAELP